MFYVNCIIDNAALQDSLVYILWYAFCGCVYAKNKDCQVIIIQIKLIIKSANLAEEFSSKCFKYTFLMTSCRIIGKHSTARSVT